MKNSRMMDEESPYEKLHNLKKSAKDELLSDEIGYAVEKVDSPITSYDYQSTRGGEGDEL